MFLRMVGEYLPRAFGRPVIIKRNVIRTDEIQCP